MHIKDLKDGELVEIESRRSTVAIAAHGLQKHSRNYYLAELVFRVIKNNLSIEDQRLLEDIKDISEGDQEREMLTTEQVYLLWPIDIKWVNTDPDKNRLESLIKEANILYI